MKWKPIEGRTSTEKACKFLRQSENWRKWHWKVFFSNCIAECVMTATVIYHVSHISLPNKEEKTGNSTRITQFELNWNVLERYAAAYFFFIGNNEAMWYLNLIRFYSCYDFAFGNRTKLIRIAGKRGFNANSCKLLCFGRKKKQFCEFEVKTAFFFILRWKVNFFHFQQEICTMKKEPGGGGNIKSNRLSVFNILH